MDKQTREARKMAKELPFAEKIKHFFEYYKWHVIVPLVIGLAVGATIYQNVTKEKYDIELSYYGDFNITEEQAIKTEKYFSQYIEDIDNDGAYETKFFSTISSTSDMEYQMGVSAKFMAEISGGTYFCYLFSEEFYDTILSYETELERVVDIRNSETLSDIFSNSDTPMYLCVRKLSERELKDEDKVKAHKNAILLLDGISQEQKND